MELAARPVNSTLSGTDDRDERAGVGEAVEVFGIDLGQLAALEAADQVTDATSAARPRVNPAAESNQGVRRAQRHLFGLGLEVQCSGTVCHAPSICAVPARSAHN